MIASYQKPRPNQASLSGPRLTLILLGGPVAWLTQLIIGYMLASHACYPHVSPEILTMTRWLSPALAVTSGSALVVAGVALVGAWRLLVQTRAAPTAPQGGLSFGAGRTSFLARVGLIVNSLFAVGCLFALTADGLVPPCG